jgi:hypothetical protein
MNKQEIINFLRKNKKHLHDKFGVTKIGIFGSIAADNYNKNSDIDIVIEIEKENKDLHNFLAIKRYLEENLNREVDLGIESNLKSAIKKEVKNKIIYA